MTLRKLSRQRLDRAKAQVEMAQIHAATLINTDAVLLLTGWSTPTLYRRMRTGFPAPAGRGKWRGGEVLGWLESEDPSCTPAKLVGDNLSSTF